MIAFATLLSMQPIFSALGRGAPHSDATALLVLDLQVDFVDADGRMPIACNQIDQVLMMSNRAIEAAAAHHLTIAYIANEYTRWDIPGNWFRHNAARSGTSGAALDPRLRKAAGASYLSKQRADAFTNPDLARLLHSHHIGRIVLSGVYADACVTATARGALRRGLAVTILSDALGAASAPSRQSALIELAGSGAQIETTDEFIVDLRRTDPRQGN